MIVVENAKLGQLVWYVGRPLLALFALDLAIVVAYVFGGWKWLALPDIPLSIFGGVIGVIVSFRNTSAYARWWEARIIWGGVVNNSRSFARQVLCLIHTPETGGTELREFEQTKRTLILLQIAYVHSLGNHLRGNAPWNDLAGLISEPEMEGLRTQSNVPLAIQQKIARTVAQCHERGWIDSIRWVSLDRTLSNLMDCQGAAERIKNTPMPLQYERFIRVSIQIYCLLLPLGMVQSLGLLTPFGSTFVGFMFLALDRIGRDLERPFENLPNDVSLSAIGRTIEINLKQMIREREIPQPLAPIDGVLW